jgi:hypothetical protein
MLIITNFIFINNLFKYFLFNTIKNSNFKNDSKLFLKFYFNLYEERNNCFSFPLLIIENNCTIKYIKFEFLNY